MNWWGILVATLGVVALTPLQAKTATNCEQSFHVFGKSAGENCVIYFQMSLRGDCLKDHLYALHLVGNSTKRFTYDLKDKDWVTGFLASQVTEASVNLQDSAGTFRIDSTRLVLPPASDSSFEARYHKLLDTTSGRAGDWRRLCRKGCFDPPRFVNATASLVYAHETGIYMNYSIIQAIWYPQTKLLILITHQPLKTKEGNGLNGVLVYRIGGIEKK